MTGETTVGQRFIQLISHLGMSKNAFAASLDKTATVIQHLVDERNKPGFDLLCKVFEVYPHVSKDWLLQGSGPMLSTETAAASEAAPPKASALATPSPEPVKQPAPSDAPLAAPAPTAPAAPSASSEIPVESSAATAAPPVSAPAVAPLAAEALQPVPVAAPTAAADTSWQTALYTQQMAHQLALAELRNQHLQDQQRLMQQMMDLMQRQMAR